MSHRNRRVVMHQTLHIFLDVASRIPAQTFFRLGFNKQSRAQLFTEIFIARIATLNSKSLAIGSGPLLRYLRSISILLVSSKAVRFRCPFTFRVQKWSRLTFTKTSLAPLF